MKNILSPTGRKNTPVRNDQISKVGFKYTRHRINKNSIVWKCHKKGCRAVLRTALDYTEHGESNVSIIKHETLQDYIFRINIIEQMKMKIQDNKMDPSDAINSVLVGSDFETI